jgi:hypothetical protein
MYSEDYAHASVVWVESRRRIKLLSLKKVVLQLPETHELQIREFDQL